MLFQFILRTQPEIIVSKNNSRFYKLLMKYFKITLNDNLTIRKIPFAKVLNFVV